MASFKSPFQLLQWMELCTSLQGNQPCCHRCNKGPATLKTVTLKSLVSSIRQAAKLHRITEILSTNNIPLTLCKDLAYEMILLKEWKGLKYLIASWPFKTFRISEVFHCGCSNCWIPFGTPHEVENVHEDDDPQRQLMKNIVQCSIDGLIMSLKKTLKNCSDQTPLRTLDLTSNLSQELGDYVCEAEFRRMVKKIIAVLDECILAGLDRKGRLLMNKNTQYLSKDNCQPHTKITPESYDNMKEANNCFCQQPVIGDGDGDGFKKPYNSESFPITEWNKQEESPLVKFSETNFEIGDWVSEGNIPPKPKSPEIGVWNQICLELNHLEDIPVYSVIIDASISEKSQDVLKWIQLRYNDFSPLSSPVIIKPRYLEVALHDERKFESLITRLPSGIQGLKFSELCDRLSLHILAIHLPHFQTLQHLDMSSCAFDLSNNSRDLRATSRAMAHLPSLEKLSLAHTCISGCLGPLLSRLQRGLTVLDISFCFLTDNDLTYLATSVHSETLVSLNLASNELGSKWGSLKLLMEELNENMLLLDLSSNDFVESQLVWLSDSIGHRFTELLFLDISRHEVKFCTLLKTVKNFTLNSKLLRICMSTPTDMEEAGFTGDDMWENFINFTSNFVSQYRVTPKLVFHWFLM